MLAVTGTDGKTTTTMMAAAMLRCAGLKVAAVGNTEVPLIAALDTDVDAFVVECSSFRLNWIDHFRSEASVWLNLAPDHQNWHVSMDAYEQAKARMWSHNRPDDVVVGYAADPVVMRNLAAAAGRQADVRRRHRRLPPGRLDAHRTGRARSPTARAMTRDLPARRHQRVGRRGDLASSPAWPVPTAVAEALATFEHPPHRIEPVGEFGGARWYNDSKATTPHAAITAIRGFDRRRAARRWPQQGPRPRQHGVGARAGEGRRRARRGGTDHQRGLRAVVPCRRGRVDERCGRRPPRPRRGAATRSCCRQVARASTGIPTAATRHAATTSSGSSTTTSKADAS